MDIILQLPLKNRKELYDCLLDSIFWNKYRKKEKIIKVKYKITNILLFDMGKNEIDTLLEILYKGDYLDFIRDLTAEVKYYNYQHDLKKLTKHEMIYIAKNRLLDYKIHYLDIYSKDELSNILIKLLYK